MPSEKEIEAAQQGFYIADEGGCELEDCWKAALEAAENARWLPIEQAPKDGTHLLITDGKQIDIGWFGVDWNIDSKGEWLRGDGDDFSTGYYFTPCKPTHFQFLPTPPTQTEE